MNLPGFRLSRWSTRAFLIALGLVVTVAIAQTPSARPCAAFFKTRPVYYGPDDQIAVDSYFLDAPFYPTQSALPYLKRLASDLRARGVLPVMAFLPPEGIAFLGKLDPSTIKGTPFEAWSAPSSLPGILAGYRETLRAFAEAGFETPDLAAGLAEHVKTNPADIMYFKHDAHWTPAGAKSAAYAVLKYLQDKYPMLTKQMRTQAVTVGVKEVVPHTSTGGWDGVILKSCPDYKPYVEALPVLELQQPEQSSSQALFGDEQFDITLVGTSFSAGAHGPGFAPYLSEAFGANVLNQGINGGGALGALNEWALNLKPDLIPRVLVWEMPRHAISNRDGFNPLTPIMLRQIMPLLEPKITAVQSLTVPLKEGLTVIDLPPSSTTIDAVRVNFDSFQTRKFRITLVLEYGSEDIDLVRSHGKSRDRFALELVSPAMVKRVVIEIFEPAQGNVTLETDRYTR
jgi:SGNH hydrolase-like domain, acetyltransferase AlgX